MYHMTRYYSVESGIEWCYSAKQWGIVAEGQYRYDDDDGKTFSPNVKFSKNPSGS